MDKDVLLKLLGKREDGEPLKIGVICIEPPSVGYDLTQMRAVLIHMESQEFDRGIVIVGSGAGIEATKRRLAEMLPPCDMIPIEDKEFNKLNINVQAEIFAKAKFPDLVFEITKTLSLQDETLLVRETFKPKHDKRDRHKPKCIPSGKQNNQMSRKSYTTRRRG